MPKIYKVSNRVVICQEKRQLVLYSEVIKEFPLVKEFLEGRKVVHKKDIDLLSDELKNFFNYGQFDKLFETAQKEWVASYKESEVDSRDKKVRCSLCNTPNVYIYFIKNKYNQTELNVGSRCIFKFPGIEILNKFNLLENKKERQKKLREIEKMKLLNERFPDALGIIEDHRKFYEQIKYILPEHIDAKIKNTVSLSKKTYDEYIDSKIDETRLNVLEKLFAEYDKEKSMVEEYYNVNFDKPFFCTPAIKIWLVNNKKNAVIRQIMRDNGFITESSIKDIYEDNFIKAHFQNRIFIIKKYDYIINSIKDSYIILKSKKDYFLFYILRHEFMKLFGNYVFNDNTSIEIDINTAKHFSIEENENNINRLIDEFNYSLRKTSYYFKVDFQRNAIEYNDKINKVFAICDLKKFLMANTYLLTLDNEHIVKDKLVSLYSLINNWRSTEDKGKYDIGKINKATYTEKGKLDIDELREIYNNMK